MDVWLRDKIKRYVRQSDRGVEPVFVGRKDLFSMVADAAGACADGQPQGQTLCLAGPPGVGKSAFLAALRARGLSGSWGGPPTLAVQVPATKLHDPHVVLDRIAERLADAQARTALQSLKERARAAAGRVLGVSALGADVALDPKREADILLSGLPGLLKGAPDGLVLCLSVDEAHDLNPTPGRKVNEILKDIHAGEYARFPMFVLLAGLSHLQNAIEPSISRLAEKRFRYVQRLSEEASRLYVNGILDHCGIQGSSQDKRRFANWVTTGCKGFPQHLRSAMTAMAEEMLRADSAKLRDLDLGRIGESIGRRRRAYYQGRVAGLETALPVIGTLFRRWGAEGTPLAKAGDDAYEALSALDAGQLRRLERAGLGTDRDLIDRMIAKGLLAAADGEGTLWNCPIPSLRRHVLGEPFRMPAPPNWSRAEGVGGQC